VRKNFCLGIFGAKQYYINMLMDNLILLYKSYIPITLVISHSILIHIQFC